MRINPVSELKHAAAKEAENNAIQKITRIIAIVVALISVVVFFFKLLFF